MLRNHPIALYCLWIIVLVILPLPLVWLLNQGLFFEALPERIVYDAGVFAYTWWLCSILLSTRPIWLDRLIGLPSLYFSHGFLGVLALGLASYHVLGDHSRYPLVRLTGHIAWYLAIFSILFAAFFLSGWLVDRWPKALQVKRRLQPIFKHQYTVWLHRLNFLLLALIWLHIQLIPRLIFAEAFKTAINFYTALTLLIYFGHKLLLKKRRFRGEIVGLTAVHSKVIQIQVALGRRSGSFHAGSFYFLRFAHVPNLSQEAHPFSVTNAPSDNSGTVLFTVETTGDFTRKLPHLPVGSTVYLEGPFGLLDSVVGKAFGRPLVLIGMGTGLAPLLSLAQQYADRYHLEILWSVRPDQKAIFDRQIEPLQALDSVQVTRQLRRFTGADYAQLLSAATLEKGQFIIVGPAPAVLQTEKLLQQLGVTPNRLADEKLTM